MANPKQRAQMTPQERGFQPIRPIDPQRPADDVTAAQHRMSAPALDRAQAALCRKLGIVAAELLWARRRYATLRAQDLALLRHKLERGELVEHLTATGRSAMLMAHRLTRAAVKADEVEQQVVARWINTGEDAPDRMSPVEEEAFAQKLAEWETSDVGRLFVVSAAIPESPAAAQQGQ
ncbi:hypothetical protein [Fontivita pretiosa]|uniref:hypothetical protein n=1 Tax=Fontivita pretiosa TaxID=2989684 RepID=UPI003D17A38E